MSFEIEHLGYKVSYSEHSSEWSCPQLSLAAPQLSALKTKMQKVEAEGRRIDNIPAIELGYRNPAPCVITLRASPIDVWIMRGKDRSKVKLNTLVLDTEENRASLAEAKSLNEQGDALRKQAEAIVGAIPRVSLAQVREEPASINA